MRWRMIVTCAPPLLGLCRVWRLPIQRREADVVERRERAVVVGGVHADAGLAGGVCGVGEGNDGRCLAADAEVDAVFDGRDGELCALIFWDWMADDFQRRP